MKNALAYRNHLEKIDVTFMNEEKHEDETVFSFEYPLENSGSRVMIFTSISDSNVLASSYCFSRVVISNPTRKNYAFEYLNQLNSKYTYFKFLLDEHDSIVCQAHLPLCDENFRPEDLFELTRKTIGVINEEYPGLMKLAWG